MSELLKYDSAWNQQQEALCKVKAMVTTATILAFSEVDKPTVVSAYASSYAYGVLLQKCNGQLHVRPVAFASRTFS